MRTPTFIPKKSKILNIMKYTNKVIENKPLVSVVMPVYNAEPYIEDSLESIIKQSYQNFEFVIVDDASTDGTFKILQKYALQDSRIKLLRNQKNRGVSETVRKAIDNARGEYIARMDADDISLPQRIFKQVQYLEKHPKTVAIGGQCILIDKKGAIIGQKTFPTKFEDIYRYIFHFVPIQQPTLMVAVKRLPKNFDYYRGDLNTAEEIELIFKLFVHGKVENLNETLLMYRMHDHNTSLQNIKKTFFLTLISRIQAMHYYNYKPTKLGILSTVLQTILVSILPQKAIFRLYALSRKTLSHNDSPLFQNHSLPARPSIKINLAS